ncbi:MAG: R3H domain-containing nucleic acid-binding protein [Patescibacteria group bacterium]
MKQMGEDASVEIIESGDFDEIGLSVQDAKMLIGEKGRNLDALECVLRVFLAGKLKEMYRFTLDVNSYRRQRAGAIKEIAQKTAKKAKLFQRAITLNPMSASERRVVHMELSTDPDVATESAGEGEMRRVVVKPR